MNFTNSEYVKTKKIIKKYIVNNYFNYSEDDISDIILKIIININNYDIEKGSFSNWVVNITKNHMNDKIKRKDIIEFGLDINNHPVYHGDNSGFITELDSKYIDDRLSSFMSVVDYDMFKMKYVEGYRYEEIGERFNVTSSTVSNRVNYIKTKIKKSTYEYFL